MSQRPSDGGAGGGPQQFSSAAAGRYAAPAAPAAPPTPAPPRRRRRPARPCPRPRGPARAAAAARSLALAGVAAPAAAAEPPPSSGSGSGGGGSPAGGPAGHGVYFGGDDFGGLATLLPAVMVAEWLPPASWVAGAGSRAAAARWDGAPAAPARTRSLAQWVAWLMPARNRFPSSTECMVRLAGGAHVQGGGVPG